MRRKKAKIINGFPVEELVRAHTLSNNHKKELEVPQKCGCFYCKTIFNSSEIKEWLTAKNPCDYLGTAICPYCDIDSVIGESSGCEITEKFLDAMNRYYFEGES